MRRLIATLILALSAVGCTSASLRPGPLPEGDIVRLHTKRYWELKDLKRIEPEPIYREWFIELESCLEKTADFNKIFWYSASYGQDPYGLSLWGIHYNPSKDNPNNEAAIVLIGTQQQTIKHEMAHFILKVNGVEGHHFTHRFWPCVKAKTGSRPGSSP